RAGWEGGRALPPAGGVERRIVHLPLVERRLPRPLEVDRVREDEARRAIDRAGREEILDLPLRLLLDPLVDGVARPVGPAAEVQDAELGPVLLARQRLVRGPKSQRAIAPQPVGDGELDLLVVAKR